MPAPPISDARLSLVVASTVRRRILDDLLALGPGDDGAGRPGLAAADIAERYGLHVTTARFHLDRLIESGVVEAFRDNRGAVGRPRKLYAARFDRVAPARPTSPYRQLSDIVDDLAARADAGEDVGAAQAGYEWALGRDLNLLPSIRAATPGAWLVKVETAAGIVSRWGHRCSLTLLEGGAAVELVLADCPFGAVAAAQPELVGRLHRGVLAGVLTRLGEPDVDVRVAPIDADGVCVAVVRTRTPLDLYVGGRELDKVRA